jgi:hypothetical protein
MTARVIRLDELDPAAAAVVRAILRAQDNATTQVDTRKSRTVHQIPVRPKEASRVSGRPQSAG